MDCESRPPNNTPVGAQEELARFIVDRRHLREDGTVKSDPFVPWKHVELSMVRHQGLTEAEIWHFGDIVAEGLRRPILGRADVSAGVFSSVQLTVEPRPLPRNPNHCDVVGWPSDTKDAQKLKALVIAKQARYKPKTT